MRFSFDKNCASLRVNDILPVLKKKKWGNLVIYSGALLLERARKVGDV